MKILLIRGLDQFFFRGMDMLGTELNQLGHTTTVRAPMFMDNSPYDILIGNSQGAVSVMNYPVLSGHKPKAIVTIDVPAHPGWKAHEGVKHLNIHGTWVNAGIVPGAQNVHISLNHLMLSYSSEMRKIVRDFVATIK